MEYIIRSVKEDLTSKNGFQWKEKGIVTCDDWSPSPTCGAGLHGLRLQQNNPGVWYTEGKILVLEVDEKTIVNIEDKCKFPKAKVVHCGTMESVTSFLSSKKANIEGMYQRTQFSSDCVTWTGGDWSILTGGYRSILTGEACSTLTGGDCSILTGGDHSTLTGGINSTLTGGINSTLTGGDHSTLTGGDHSTLTGGDHSTLTGGDHSTLTGGDHSTLSIRWYDGYKYRISIAYVGENGIEPNVPYKLNTVGEFVVA